MKLRFLLLTLLTSACAKVRAADVISNTAVFGFPDMLSFRNVTSKGFNFGDSAGNAANTTLLTVPFYGNQGVNDVAHGLTYTSAPLTYAIGGFTWNGAPEQAARDTLSMGGLHGGSADFAMKLSATAGQSYVLEVLALDAFAGGGRSMDIIIDGVTVINDWVVPVGNPYNKLARIRVLADADGIDLRLGVGGAAGTSGNPAISAITLTEEIDFAPTISIQPCPQNQPVGGTATFSVVALGSPTPTFQWRKNESPLSGKTASTLTLTGLSVADIAEYDVVVTNTIDSVTSAKAALSVVPIVASSSITADLKGYWRFDEAIGCTAADTSGQGQSGNLKNFSPSSNTYWTTGQVGGALRFAGTASQQYVVVPTVPLPTASTYTVAAWVMADSRPTWASIAKNWFGFLHFGLDSNGGQMSNYFGLNGGGFVRNAETEVFPLGVWQHVVCTVDATNMKLYRNGTLVATQPMSGTPFSPNPLPLAIGAKLTGSSPDSFWHGLIDELALWHRSLTAGEISNLYGAGVQGLSLDNPNPMPPANELVISEFISDNAGGAQDGDFDSSDWVEIYNGTAASVDLNGYYLTDNLTNKTKWKFPSVTMAPGSYLLVWASGKDRRVAGQPLHSSFSLSDHEDLALVAPDGLTVVHAFTSPYSFTSPHQWRESYTNISQGLLNGLPRYFRTPTPGGVNSSGVSPLGPLIENELHLPLTPTPATPITVTARIQPDQSTALNDNSIVSVTLKYRVMFGPEISLSMADDGLHGDGAAGDQIYGAIIPSSHGASAGQMIRWAIVATTTQGGTTRAPHFLIEDSPEYFGTVIADPSITTPLPVLHRFIESPALADTLSGTFCSIYFNGEFHDRCRIRIRGNTSRAWPKKSHKIDLPPGSRVPLRLVVVGETELPQVSELNINTTYTDKSYTRAVIAAEMHAISGAPTPEIFHLHQRENGAFYSVALCTENVDDIFLKKHGIDDHGSFYKAVGDAGACDFTTAAAFEKKNRHSEGLGDLQDVVTNLGLTGTALENWLFDNVDLPSWVNWHAGTVISQNIDASNKNYYIHRDTLGSREWSIIPWDLDLTFGPNALNTDTMVYNQSDPGTPICTSHPLIGARPWQLSNPKFNRMIEALAKTPRTRQMIARRIRSLNDQFLTNNWFGFRMDSLQSLLTTDVNADHAKWTTNSHFAWSGGTAYSMADSISRIKSLYLSGRSTYLTDTTGSNHGAPYSLDFTSGAGSLGVPSPHSITANINFGTTEANPASGNQDQEFVELTNPNAFDVDLSAWTIEGGVTFTFPGGTILPAGQSLFVTPDRYAFRQRATSPKGGEGRFVLGPYSGHLSNFGEILVLKNSLGGVINTISIPAAPTDAQRYLAISEIHYNPAGSTDDTEYLEFINTSSTVSLSLENIKITAGLTGTNLTTGLPEYFTFAPATMLPPGGTILVARNSTAFQAAWPSVSPTLIAGHFPADTSLDNGGERLKVEDAQGNTIVEFTYDDNDPWPTIPDGSGHSLVHMNPQSGDIHHSAASNWRASVAMGGSPGTLDALPPPANPLADDDQDGLNNLLEHVLGDNAPFGVMLDGLGSVIIEWDQRPGADTGRVIVEASTNLTNWNPVTNYASKTQIMDGSNFKNTLTAPTENAGRKYFRARIETL